MREHAWRSVLKALSWRFLATIDTVVLAFLFTRNIRVALSIGGFEIITKGVLYVLHERAWHRVDAGRKMSEEGGLHEHHGRSVMKAFTWRAVGALDTFVISFIITGHPVVSLSISGAELFTKVGIYYLHERAWACTIFGLKKLDPEDAEESEEVEEAKSTKFHLRCSGSVFSAYVVFSLASVLVLIGIASAISSRF